MRAMMDARRRNDDVAVMWIGRIAIRRAGAMTAAGWCKARSVIAAKRPGSDLSADQGSKLDTNQRLGQWDDGGDTLVRPEGARSEGNAQAQKQLHQHQPRLIR